VTCPRIVGLDLSLTRTGVAMPDGTVSVLRPSERGMQRLAWLRREIALVVEGADLVAVEGYAYARANQAHQLGELGGVIRLLLHECGVRYVDVPPAVLKRYATGRGNAGKGQVLVEAVKRLGYEGSDDNEADALWLRALALDAYGHPVVRMPQAQRDAAVRALTWPRLTRRAA
jgi:Holliday junction resolvasome RuvABC endonuclease subunit